MGKRQKQVKLKATIGPAAGPPRCAPRPSRGPTLRFSTGANIKDFMSKLLAAKRKNDPLSILAMIAGVKQLEARLTREEANLAAEHDKLRDKMLANPDAASGFQQTDSKAI